MKRVRIPMKYRIKWWIRRAIGRLNKPKVDYYEGYEEGVDTCGYTDEQHESMMEIYRNEGDMMDAYLNCYDEYPETLSKEERGEEK